MVFSLFLNVSNFRFLACVVGMFFFCGDAPLFPIHVRGEMKVFSILLLGMQGNNDPPPLPSLLLPVIQPPPPGCRGGNLPDFLEEEGNRKKFNFQKSTILFQLKNLLQRLIL